MRSLIRLHMKEDKCMRYLVQPECGMGFEDHDLRPAAGGEPNVATRDGLLRLKTCKAVTGTTPYSPESVKGYADMTKNSSSSSASGSGS